MKAAYYEGNRHVAVRECIPVPPGPDEVQVKIAYCGICGTDLHLFHGKMDHRIQLPQVFGHEVSGTVATVGENVTDFAPGDPVTVRPLAPCGGCPACLAGNSHICQRLKFIGIDRPGGLQAFWTVPSYTLHRLPLGLSLKTAALVEPLAVACHDVRRGKVQPNEYVVVQGGGPIGILIALVAREAGGKVLISEVNPFRLQLVRDLGFEALNPMEQDIVAHVNERTNTAGADVIFEVSGSVAGSQSMTKLAKVRGRIVIVAVFGQSVNVDLFQFFWRELELAGARVYEPADFEEAISLLQRGVLPLDKLISEVCSLEDTQTSIERLESGGNVMKILVKCSTN
jgi:(R,R)-butanediol dehydrogenase/meso-butanediol dehydrogenase/diacetyl reductase